MVIIGGSAVALVGALAAVGAWTALRAAPPPPASLAAALQEVSTSVPRAVALSPAVSVPEWAAIPGQGAAPADLAGHYAIVSGPSFAGYRVKEVLGGLGANTVVGRSRDVSASFAFDGRLVSDLDVTVDLRALTSDDERRDGQLRMQALESDRYPTARFAVSTPFSIGAVPPEGEELHVVLYGDLTLHGVTRPVIAHVYGARKGELAVLVGTTDVLFSDFGIKRPQSIVVVSVDDYAVVEFQLVFKKT